MTLEEIYKISNGTIINGKITNKNINKIKIDSRKIKKNDLFICVKGMTKDGHDYIEDVINECSCIIVEKNIEISSKILIIRVDNTIKFMNDLALEIRKNHLDIPLIAITGSMGKTTTKELLKHILESKYNILYSKGNNNNHIGLPLTLFELEKNNNLIITEIGMNHLNEIKKLSNICLPNIGIITNIGTSHIGNLNGKKNILKAKLEIISGMNNGKLILNTNDKMLRKIKKINNNILININDFEVKNIINTQNNLLFTLKYNEKKYNIRFKIPNPALIDILLIVIKTSLMLGLTIEEIIKKLETFNYIEGRSNIIKIKNNSILVDDCYNANLESMIASINMIKNFKNKKILILGDILELGKYSKRIHKKLGKYLHNFQKQYNTDIITVGKEIKIIKKYCDCINLDSNDKIIEYLKKINIDNKCILLKASRRMHLEQIKKYLI